MPQQHEMFEPPKLSLIVPAAGQKEPRLWVRRLAIWEAPGGEKIRDISLRSGLNIIWSPDGFDDSGAGGVRAIGHGSGKTLFCRLLRYCLGEQRFADETQRERIAVAFPNGIVGAEVMLDGVCWAVVRPLGIRRRHVAIADGNLDEIAAGDGATTSIDPLIEAIEQNIVTPGVAGLARLLPGQNAASTTFSIGAPPHPAPTRRCRQAGVKPGLGAKHFGHSLRRLLKRSSRRVAPRTRCEQTLSMRSAKFPTLIGTAAGAAPV
jgi:hypothetical protein